MRLKELEQILMDKLSPCLKLRWAITGIIVAIYIIRIAIVRKYAVITYFSGIYLLHNFILFATPNDDSIPDPFSDNYTGEITHPTIDNDFKPYVRKLPEYSFWLFSTGFICTAFFLTLFDFTDIPVFTPLLIFYFIFIFLITGVKMYYNSRLFKYNIFSAKKQGFSD